MNRSVHYESHGLLFELDITQTREPRNFFNFFSFRFIIFVQTSEFMMLIGKFKKVSLTAAVQGREDSISFHRQCS